MADPGDPDSIVALPVDVLVEEVFGGMQPEPVDIGDGRLKVFQGHRSGRKVTIVAFDPSSDHGAIGRPEAEQLVRAMRLSETGSALIFAMNTSGILVTDSTHGIASLRKVLREAEEARLRGVRMLAVIVKQAFGGASILAGLCERRIIHSGALFAMSGPRLIEQTVGRDVFDSRNRGHVDEVLGGRARASMSDGFVCVPASAAAYRLAVDEWFDGNAEPVSFSALVDWGTRLAARFPRPAAHPEPMATEATLLNDPAARILDTIDPSGFELRTVGGVVIATPRSGTAPTVFALMAIKGCGFVDAVALGRELLELKERSSAGAEVVLVVDSESHAATPADERCVLSEALAFLALSLRCLSLLGGLHVRVIVSGLGGGGIQGALGSAANSVSMGPGARLRVLPTAAMQALNKSEDSEAGSLAVAIAAGAVDGEFTITPRRREEMASHVGQ